MTLVSLEPGALATVLPTPEELNQEIPFKTSHAAFIQKSRETIEAILNGWDPRLLLIVGPCSIHDPQAALEYGRRLKPLADQIADRFFVIMRTYFEKPRTIIGWKGMLYDPGIDGSYQLARGVRQTRQLLSDLTEMGIPTGCELLEINTLHYYADFVSWGCIGARTSSSQPHRQLAASLNLPIGFKNSTEGNVDHAVHGILAAATPHTYLGLAPNGQMAPVHAKGNPACHVVLRGGQKGPNYHADAIRDAVKKCQKANVCSRLIIDCSHDNCGKKPQQQKAVLDAAVDQVLEGNRQIAGMMLESHLYGGAQDIVFPLHYGVSITDPCLDWESTSLCLLEAHQRFQLVACGSC